MADHLITTTEQIRTYVPVAASFKIDEIQPQVNDVEQEFIIPLISQELFDYLRGLSSPTGADAELLNRCRNALSKLAVMRWIPFGNVNVQSGGFTVKATETGQVASQWRVDKLEEDLRRDGWNSLERILTYLFSQDAGTWTQWDASDEKIEARNWLILTAGEFNKYYHINNSYELFCRVKPGQREVMNQYIKPTLGDDLYNQLLDQISDNDLNADNVALLEMVKRVAAPLTIYESVASMGIDLSHWGITTAEGADNGDNTVVRKNAPSDRLSYAMRKAGDDGRKHLGALRAFLNNNASSTKYSLYYDSDLYNAPSNASDTGDNINDSDSGIVLL